VSPIPPLIRWNRSSTVLLTGFFLAIFLIIYFWWPLAEAVLSYIDWRGRWWLQMDWLLIGLFLFMTFAIVARADLQRDVLIVVVATVGGLVIEAWGTQTNLWHYYTSERPPLWIVPAWPIATLSIDRITRVLDSLVSLFARGLCDLTTRASAGLQGILLGAKALYWILFAGFMVVMVVFIAPTFDKAYTVLALLLCILIILSPVDYRRTVEVFVAGAALGYFLELWGTTRECWTYYTHQTPPLFAVLAHGMAAVAFWRSGLVLALLIQGVRAKLDSARRPEAGRS
jgi:hypothetical protein